MITLIEEIAQGRWFDRSKVEGYTEEEIAKIERLYDINIKGILKDFMLEMGCCDGELLGDDPTILYRDLWSVRDHILVQNQINESINDIIMSSSIEKMMEKLDKPIVFAIEAETPYYYITTGHTKPYTVFHYDENTDIVEDTGEFFVDYLKSLTRFYGKYTPQIICRGDIITI